MLFPEKMNVRWCFLVLAVIGSLCVFFVYSFGVGYNPVNCFSYDFDIEGDEVIVFLHIQKTGGTVFGRNLVKNIQLEKPCKCYRRQKRCDCENSQNHIWLFSRFSTGWSCGLHADWTELKNCVDSMMDHKESEHRQRKYVYQLKKLIIS